MIFVMIAGTCTPFALSAFPKNIGLLVCTLVWIIAMSGAVLNLHSRASSNDCCLACI